MRNAPEKLFVLDFLDLMPPTLVTRSPDAIKAFRDEHKDIIVKPLYGNGGAAVFRIAPGDTNLNSLIELFGRRVPRAVHGAALSAPRCARATSASSWSTARWPAPSTACRPPDETRSNLHVGGTAEPADADRRATRRSARRLGPELKKRGLIFVGIDVIGDYLTEINVTSPTGIRQVAQFGGADIAAMIWDAIEAKVKREKKR